MFNFKKSEPSLNDLLPPCRICSYKIQLFSETKNDDIKLDDYERFMLAQELAEKLNKNVDLIDLRQATTVFQTQIVSTGKVIFCNDNNRRMNFEMLTLKMYAKLNDERKEILEKIQESGEVYEVRRHS